jgi:hypothetical protein
VRDQPHAPFGQPIATSAVKTLKPESSSISINTRYSHWDVTGVGPARPSPASPLDYAIAFEQYRLTIVSAWPDSEDKQERLRGITSALRRLESARRNG